MDKLETIQAFVAVAESGGFTRAAEKLQMSPQLVSKYIGQLEARLGVRLLNRTTRKVSVTEAGQNYLHQALHVLDAVESMDAEVSNLQGSAQGLLRISAPVSFAIQHITPLLCDFRQAYPSVGIDLQLNDRKVDIVDEGFDIALRIGQLKSSSLIAKHIAPIRMVFCASKAYLEQHGEPQTPQDLASHHILRYSYSEFESQLFGAEWAKASVKKSLPVFESNNGDVLAKAAIAGQGIALKPTFIVGEALKSGLLMPILREYEPEPLGLYAVYAHRHYMANKVRSFLDFISDYYGSPPYWDEWK